jgi:tRNA threonylcarbamoyladenosine biosynthesis protein TsaB
VSPIILAIDTALSACSVAITRGDQTLVSRREPMARGQAERLAPLVQELVKAAGLQFAHIDTIGVTTGPGTFTGLRVGLAFARGLALALDRPCIGISTLEVLAAGAGAPKVIAAIEVAGSVFVGAWTDSAQTVAPSRPDLTAFLASLNGDWTVTGPGAAAILAHRPHWHHMSQDTPDPVVLAKLTRNADPATHRPDPLYLRGVDAKLPGGIILADVAN